MSSVFKRLRQPAVCDVLRKAAYIGPSAILYVLFKAFFKYPLYFFTLLLFVKNIRALTEMFLFRDSVRCLEFRWGLGRFRLNVEEVLLFAELLSHGIYCYNIGDRVFAHFRGGYISSPNINRLSFLIEPFDKQYHVFDYAGRVLDVGGYLGETAFLFKTWGSDEVVVYEPDHVLGRHARETMLLNGVKGVVHELYVNCSSSHNSISWSEVLEEKFDIAKLDCEGCEKGLLSLPDEYLRNVPKWVMECHHPQILSRLANKFLKAGFRVTYKLYLREKGVYNFLRCEMEINPQTKIPKGFMYILIAHRL